MMECDDCCYVEELDGGSLFADDEEYVEELWMDSVPTTVVNSSTNKQQQEALDNLLDSINRAFKDPAVASVLAAGSTAGVGTVGNDSDDTDIHSPHFPDAIGLVFAFDDETNRTFVTSKSRREIECELVALQALLDNGFIEDTEFAERKLALGAAIAHCPKEPLGAVHTGPRSSASAAERHSRAANNKNRNVRVFLSSTFADMKSEREVLLKQVFPELQKLCSDRGVFLTPVDLRWGITSDQSMAGDTINICLKEVDNCRPYFVCFMGNRYGWAQEKGGATDKLLQKSFKKAEIYFPWVTQFIDRSITELEIRHAVLNAGNEETAANSLFYFRNSNERSSSKQESLKEEIIQAGLAVERYDTAEQLGKLVLEDMKQKFEKQFPLSEKPHPMERERQGHVAFQESRSRVYIGRQEYFDKINDLLGSGDRPVVVVGESGSGKSALVANWVHRHEHAYPDRLVIAHYIGSTASSAELSVLLRRLLWEIDSYFGLNKNIPSNPTDMIRVLPEFLLEASNKGGCTIILDALNQLNPADNSHALNWLPLHYPPRVQVLVSTLPGKALDVLTKLRWYQIRVEALGEDERTQFVEEYMAKYSKTLTETQTHTLVAAPQCGNPLYLRTVMEELRVFGSYEQLNARITHYLVATDPPSLFQRVFERLETDYNLKTGDNKNIVADLLSVLWTSRKGLSEAEVASLLKLPHAVFSPLLIALENFLVSRSGLITFFHDYMRQAVFERYLQPGGKQTEVARRRQLVAFFNVDGDRQVCIRRCEEVPYQLQLAADWDGLNRFITDRKNLEYLVQKANRMDLLQYWREAAHHVNMENALIRSLSAISYVDGLAGLKLLMRTGEFLKSVAAFKSAESVLMVAESVIQRAATVRGVDPRWQNVDTDGKQTEVLRALADLHQQAGKYVEAYPLFERALATLRSKEHPSTKDQEQLARLLHDFGTLRRKQGMYAESSTYLEEALRVRKDLFGENHTSVAETYNEMGRLKQGMGQYNDAEVFFEKSLHLCEALFGEIHPKVAQGLQDIGDLYRLSSKFSSAYSFLEKATKLYETIFGRKHPSVAETIQSTASVRQQQGLWKEAQTLYEEAVEIQRATLGNIHPDLALTLNDFGGLFLRQGMFQEAEPRYRESLSIREATLGREHVDYALTLASLASLHQKQQQYTEALFYFQQALSIMEKSYGDKHLDIASTCLNIAGVYQQTSKPADALPLYVRALNILLELLGPKHGNVAVILNDVSIMYYNLKEHKKAEQTYLLAVDAYDAIFSRLHPSTAQVLLNVGMFYNRTADRAKALDYFRESHRIFAQVLGEEDPKTKAAAEQISNLDSFGYEAMDRDDDEDDGLVAVPEEDWSQLVSDEFHALEDDADQSYDFGEL